MISFKTWWAHIHGETKRHLSRAAGVYASQIGRGGLAFASNVLCARLLDPDRFGRFVFIQALLTFGFLFEGGVAIAACRLFAFSSDREEHRALHGAWLLLFLPILGAFAGVLFAVSGLIEALFHIEVGTVLRLCALFSTGILLNYALSEILTGSGNVRLLIALNVSPWLCFSGFLGLLWWQGYNSVRMTALAYTFSFFVTSILVVILLRPKFRGGGEQIRRIWNETRSYGIHVFLNRALGTGTFQLDSPMIAYFTKDTASVGFYGLAKIITSPIPLFSRSLGIALFRPFSKFNRIPPRYLKWNYVWLFVACAAIFLLGKPLVRLTFPPEYARLLPLLYVWGVVAFIQGTYQLPGSFLSVVGEGKGLRNIAVGFAITNLIGNFALIPSFGAMGASIASGISYLFWMVATFALYKRTVKLRQENGTSGG